MSTSHWVLDRNLAQSKSVCPSSGLANKCCVTVNQVLTSLGLLITFVVKEFEWVVRIFSALKFSISACPFPHFHMALAPSVFDWPVKYPFQQPPQLCCHSCIFMGSCVNNSLDRPKHFISQGAVCRWEEETEIRNSRPCTFQRLLTWFKLLTCNAFQLFWSHTSCLD